MFCEIPIPSAVATYILTGQYVSRNFHGYYDILSVFVIRGILEVQQWIRMLLMPALGFYNRILLYVEDSMVIDSGHS